MACWPVAWPPDRTRYLLPLSVSLVSARARPPAAHDNDCAIYRTRVYGTHTCIYMYMEYAYSRYKVKKKEVKVGRTASFSRIRSEKKKMAEISFFSFHCFTVPSGSARRPTPY